MTKPVIIVDTCFLGWLERFANNARAFHFDPPVAPERMPFTAALDCLIANGYNVVIPNEVLKESMKDKQGRIGLGKRGSGEVYLDHDLLEHNHAYSHIRMHDWVLAKESAGKVRCFGTPESFLKAKADHKLNGGTLAVVAGFPITNGNGHDHNGESRGDPEIMNIINAFNRAPLTNYTPSFVATCDQPLQRSIKAMSGFGGPRSMLLTPNGFLAAMKKCGQLDDRLLMPSFLDYVAKDEKFISTEIPTPAEIARLSAVGLFDIRVDRARVSA